MDAAEEEIDAAEKMRCRHRPAEDETTTDNFFVCKTTSKVVRIDMMFLVKQKMHLSRNCIISLKLLWVAECCFLSISGFAPAQYTVK